MSPTPATTPADGELLPAPTTYMNEDDARHWAWQHAKKDLGTDNLSIGENASNMAFFISGWAYKGQYESQRAPESFEQWFDQTSGFTKHDEAVARAAWQACAALATPSPGKAPQDDAPEVWGLRIGDSDRWAYTETEADADFLGKQSGLPYEKRRYVLASPGKADAEDAERIDYTLTRGDIAYSPHWGEGRARVEVVDVNWALRAIAVRLAPNGGIVVWPASSLHRERDKQ